jgi:hypothetical protein
LFYSIGPCLHLQKAIDKNKHSSGRGSAYPASLFSVTTINCHTAQGDKASAVMHVKATVAVLTLAPWAK